MQKSIQRLGVTDPQTIWRHNGFNPLLWSVACVIASTSVARQTTIWQLRVLFPVGEGVVYRPDQLRLTDDSGLKWTDISTAKQLQGYMGCILWLRYTPYWSLFAQN